MKKSQVQPVLAIVGRPNVGKSTLFNRLIGRRAAIVKDEPGVTRDRNYALADWRGRSFIVIDTGGFEPAAEDGLFAQIREQIRLAMEEADAIILVVDAKAGLTPSDVDIANQLRRYQKPIRVAVNKVDGEKDLPLCADFYGLGLDDVLPVSAEHGLGVGELLDSAIASLPQSQVEYCPKDAIRVAVIGRPNVGKSSFLNKLIGEERFLVDEAPGTTRDSTDTILRRDGKAYLFVDTAGIRRKGKVSLVLEKYSVVMALKSIQRCDVALLMLDASNGVTEQDAKIGGYTQEAGCACIIAINKCDLIGGDSDRFKQLRQEVKSKLKFLSYAPIMFTSAMTGYRVAEALKLIDTVAAEFSKRVPTSALNEVLHEAFQKHTLPSRGKGHVKFYYASQVKTGPPTIVLFFNYPADVHFTYSRYIQNRLREAFGFKGTPIRLSFRRKR